ncbi:MAG: ribonuclease P protein component [Pararhodobacter sp.]
MMPPDAPLNPAQAAPAVSECLAVLTKRAEFLAAARARRVPAAGFLLQARERGGVETAAGIRVGFTCSKKVGNAVIRNRAKRRLRALAQEILPALGLPGWDYVLVGKPRDTVEREFDALRQDLIRAMARIHG